MSRATRPSTLIPVALSLVVTLSSCPGKPPKDPTSTPPGTLHSGSGPEAAEPPEVGPVSAMLRDVLFDFDRSDVRDDQKPVLEQNAGVMKSHPGVRFVIEGHADERGSVEYNLALGERRARATHAYLTSLGIGTDRLSTVSYGKELPADPGHHEEAWARNRRAHFIATR